jgi:hypothetical protein
MGEKSKRGHRFLVAMTVLVIAGIATALLVASSQEASLAAKVAEAKKVGFPFEGKDLAPKPAYPETQNAARRYIQAKTIEKSTTFTDATKGRELITRSREQAIDQEEQAVLSQYLKELEPAIDEFQLGAAMPYCYFQHDWDLGANVLFPEYADMKTLVRTVCARAELRAASGASRGAVDDLVSAHRAAVHIGQQPPLIALLVSIASEAIVSRSVEELLPLAANDPEFATGLRSVADSMPEKWDLTGFLRTEAFFGWWTAEHLSDAASYLGMGGNEPIEVRLTKNSQTTVRAVKWSILEIYTPILRDYKPFDDERATYSALATRSNAELNEAVLAKPYLAVLLPVFEAIPTSLDRFRARRRMLLASLDLIAHRRAHGSWPKSLAEVGEFKDPFDGKPLRFRPEGGGFRVWSVGANKVDDGGKSRQESKGGDFDEVVVFKPTLAR